MREIRGVIGEIPILAAEQRMLDAASGEGELVDVDDDNNGKEKREKRGPKVLEDGTYATETALTSSAKERLEAHRGAKKPPLRSRSFFFSSFCTTPSLLLPFSPFVRFGNKR